MKPRDLWIGFAAVLTVYVYGNCREAVGAKRAVQNQRDIRDNITIARMAAESFQAETVSRRAIAVADAKASRASHRADSLETALLQRPDTLYTRTDITELVATEKAARDSLTASNGELRLANAMLNARVAAYRDTLVPQLVVARENWKRAAQPGLLTQVVRAVPYVLAGAVLWEAVR